MRRREKAHLKGARAGHVKLQNPQSYVEIHLPRLGYFEHIDAIVLDFLGTDLDFEAARLCAGFRRQIRQNNLVFVKQVKLESRGHIFLGISHCINNLILHFEHALCSHSLVLANSYQFQRTDNLRSLQAPQFCGVLCLYTFYLSSSAILGD